MTPHSLDLSKNTPFSVFLFKITPHFLAKVPKLSILGLTSPIYNTYDTQQNDRDGTGGTKARENTLEKRITMTIWGVLRGIKVNMIPYWDLKW